MRPVEKVLGSVDGVEERANGYWCLCPAHDDHDPSLHVEEGEDGRVLMVCRAGCSQAEVLAALEERGLSRRDLFERGSGEVVSLNARPKAPKKGSREAGPERLAASWSIRDASERVVAIHERLERPSGEKRFRWRHPDGRISQKGEISSAMLPLYGSERVGGWPEDRGVVLVEGEKAADALLELGIRALGTVTGSAVVPAPEALEVLAGRQVVVWPDDDRSGREHMRRVAERLQGIAREVRWFEWEGPADVKGPDAADHPAIVAGDRAGLEALARELAEAPAWQPEEPQPAEAPPSLNGRGGVGGEQRFNLTDLGNSERFVADHGDDVRYCYPWRKWLVWNGARWERDDAGVVHRLAKETVRGIYREAADAEDDGRRKALAQHATRSEAEPKIRAMLELAKSELPVSPDELDVDPWLLNAENGTIELRTGVLREHRREDLITKMAPVEYSQDTSAPLWATTLERVLPSPALRAFFKKLCGYALSGDTSEHLLPVLYGIGANGKSTILNALLAVTGSYGTQAAPDLLVAKKGSHPTELADLFGMRLVASIEVEDGRRLAESLVKQLTGGDRVKARRMREDFWEFDPTHTVFMAVNHKPIVRGTDTAIWRRIRLIPFTETIPPAEQDKQLPAKLRDELPGILAWMVRGCLEWQREGLQAPDEVRRATAGYRSEMDVLGDFLADRCLRGERLQVRKDELYRAYQEWCEDAGERPETKRKFGMLLKERGFADGRNSERTKRIWKGIGLSAAARSVRNSREDEDVSGGESGIDTQETHGRAAPPGHKTGKSPINPRKTDPRGVNGEIVSDVSDVSEEQLQRLRKLREQGMREDLAREEVLGKGWVEP